MQGFQFQTVKTILSEPGSSTRVGALARELGAERALLLYNREALRHSGWPSS